MGQHKTNPTAIAAKEGKIKPKVRHQKMGKHALARLAAKYAAQNGWSKE